MAKKRRRESSTHKLEIHLIIILMSKYLNIRSNFVCLLCLMRYFTRYVLVNKQTSSFSELICNSDGAKPELTQVSHLKKWKRNYEETSGSDRTSPGKRRRRSQGE